MHIAKIYGQISPWGWIAMSTLRALIQNFIVAQIFVLPILDNKVI